MKNAKFCKRGHERIPENLYFNGGCKLCEKVRRSLLPSDSRHHVDQKKANAKRIAELTDEYIAHLLSMTIEEARAVPKLIKLKRENILLKRRLAVYESVSKQ